MILQDNKLEDCNYLNIIKDKEKLFEYSRYRIYKDEYDMRYFCYMYEGNPIGSITYVLNSSNIPVIDFTYISEQYRNKKIATHLYQNLLNHYNTIISDICLNNATYKIWTTLKGKKYIYNDNAYFVDSFNITNNLIDRFLITKE